MKHFTITFFMLFIGVFAGCASSPAYIESTSGGYAIAIQPQFSQVREFREGLAAAAVSRGRRGDSQMWGFINAYGEWVIEPQFYFALDFHHGVAVVNFEPYNPATGDSIGTGGVIDRTGRVIVEPGRFAAITSARHGYLRVIKSDEYENLTLGLLDLNGEEVVPPIFPGMRPYMGYGVVAVRNDEGLWGVINLDLEVIVPFRFDELSTFSAGRAFAREGDTYGYICTAGEWADPPLEDEEFPAGIRIEVGFVDGVRLVGLVGVDGTEVVPLRFHRIESVSEGKAAFQYEDGGLWGFISLR